MCDDTLHHPGRSPPQLRRESFPTPMPPLPFCLFLFRRRSCLRYVPVTFFSRSRPRCYALVSAMHSHSPSVPLSNLTRSRGAVRRPCLRDCHTMLPSLELCNYVRCAFWLCLDYRPGLSAPVALRRRTRAQEYYYDIRRAPYRCAHASSAFSVGTLYAEQATQCDGDIICIVSHVIHGVCGVVICHTSGRPSGKRIGSIRKPRTRKRRA